MIIRPAKVGLSLLLLASSSLACADLRVLFSFSEAGVQVHRVMTLETRSDFTAQLAAEALTGQSADSMRLRWLDANGRILANTLEPDPRVAQAPDHVNASRLSRLGLQNGSWVAAGPDGAESVEVILPEQPGLALAAQTWSLSLTPDN